MLEYMKGGQMVTHPCAPLPRIEFFIQSPSPSPKPDTCLSAVVCVARKPLPCPSYSRRRDCNNCVHRLIGGYTSGAIPVRSVPLVVVSAGFFFGGGLRCGGGAGDLELRCCQELQVQNKAADMAKITREFDILKSLRHHNIVKVCPLDWDAQVLAGGWAVLGSR